MLPNIFETLRTQQNSNNRNFEKHHKHWQNAGNFLKILITGFHTLRNTLPKIVNFWKKKTLETKNNSKPVKKIWKTSTATKEQLRTQQFTTESIPYLVLKVFWQVTYTFNLCLALNLTPSLTTCNLPLNLWYDWVLHFYKNLVRHVPTFENFPTFRSKCCSCYKVLKAFWDLSELQSFQNFTTTQEFEKRNFQDNKSTFKTFKMFQNFQNFENSNTSKKSTCHFYLFTSIISELFTYREVLRSTEWNIVELNILKSFLTKYVSPNVLWLSLLLLNK